MKRNSYVKLTINTPNNFFVPDFVFFLYKNCNRMDNSSQRLDETYTRSIKFADE